MFKIDLNCRCDNELCNAELLVRVPVSIIRIETDMVLLLGLHVLQEALRDAGWRLATTDADVEVLFCPRHR